MTRDAAGKRKLPEQFFHARRVLRYIRIDFAVAAFQISIRDHARAAVPWSGDEEHVEIEFVDQPIAMRINEIQAGRGAPMTQQARFDMTELQGFAQQRIIEQINLADGKIIGRAPIGIEVLQFVMR